MNPVTRNNQTTAAAPFNNSALQEWLFRNTLENFEPNLTFYAAGEKPLAADGYATVAWAKFSQIASSSVTTGTTSDDGTTPNGVAFTAGTIKATPVQYRLVVRISDVVAQLNAIGFVQGALREIGAVMARKIDEVIQTEVMAGTNVRYAGVASSRVTVASTHILTANAFNVANAILASKYAPTFDGYYIAFVHPFGIADLRKETGTGSWLEVNKYATPDKVFKGEIGMLNGVRIVMAPYVQKFAGAGAAGIDVFPTLVVGRGAYGVTDFQSLRTYVVPATPSDSDPAAQRTSVATKVAFVPKRLHEDSMLRIEHACTVL